jgi:hypothetical protein
MIIHGTIVDGLKEENKTSVHMNKLGATSLLVLNYLEAIRRHVRHALQRR